MWFEESERLKAEYTDKHVVVLEGVPELRRFSGQTGIVKTVNMSGRALVEFTGTVDIGWYDINPDFLTIVDAPDVKGAATAQTTQPAPAEKKPAAKLQKGLSPLEAARQQGAASSSGAAAAAPAAEQPKSATKKLSPLELARQQDVSAGAAGKTEAKGESVATQVPESAPSASNSADTANLSPLELARLQDAGGVQPPAQPAAPTKPTPKAAIPTSGATADRKLSPLELARQQDSSVAKRAPESSPPADEAPSSEMESEPDVPSSTEGSAAGAEEIPTTGPDGKPLSIPELARLQGPFKG